MEWPDRLIRIAMTIAVVALASIAFIVSYRHAYALGLRLGEHPTTAAMIPLTIDGLLLAAALTGLFTSRYGLPQPRLARFALFLGVGATVGVNVAEGIARGVWAAVFAAWPAVALVISSELLLWVIGAGRTLSKKTTVIVDKPPASPLAQVASLLANEPGITGKAIASKLSIPYPKALELMREARSLIKARA